MKFEYSRFKVNERDRGELVEGITLKTQFTHSHTMTDKSSITPSRLSRIHFSWMDGSMERLNYLRLLIVNFEFKFGLTYFGFILNNR